MKYRVNSSPNVRLVQNESIARQQSECDSRVRICFKKGEKIVGKGENGSN